MIAGCSSNKAGRSGQRTWIYVEDGADRISLLAWLFFVRGVGGVGSKGSSEVLTWKPGEME